MTESNPTDLTRKICYKHRHNDKLPAFPDIYESILELFQIIKDEGITVVHGICPVNDYDGGESVLLYFDKETSERPFECDYCGTIIPEDIYHKQIGWCGVCNKEAVNED